VKWSQVSTATHTFTTDKVQHFLYCGNVGYLQDSQGCINIWNDLYCVRWGVKLYPIQCCSRCSFISAVA